MEEINVSNIPEQPLENLPTRPSISKPNTFKYLFIICFILLLISVFFSVLTIKYFKSKIKTTEPNITKVTPTTIPTAIPTEEIINEVSVDDSIKDWKTYKSKRFNASISLPNDWQDVWPADGTLHETNVDQFEGYFSLVSSPDEKEQIFFEYGQLDVGNHTCTVKNIYINNQRVNEIICPDTMKNENPNKYNYEFIDKNLSISFYNKTPTIDKIISLIKFN